MIYVENNFIHISFALKNPYRQTPDPPPSTPGQALDLLVAVSCAHRCAYTPALSTPSSPGGLTPCGWELPSWGGLHA